MSAIALSIRSRLVLTLLFFLIMVTGCSAQNFNKDRFVVQLLTYSLFSQHYAPPVLDNALSSTLFDEFLENLDPQKRFLTKQDIQKLESYRYLVDDQLLSGKTDFFDLAIGIYSTRIKEVEQLVVSLLKNPFPLQSTGTIETDPKKTTYVSEMADLTSLWQKRLTYQCQLTYIEKAEAKALLEKKSTSDRYTFVLALLHHPDPSLIEASQKKLKKDNTLLFKNLKKETRKDRLNVYLNTLAHRLDPHTDYMAPEEKENFDIGISGTLEGIGAVLKEEEGFIKVSSIVVGSASWRQKELKAEDIILKVGQGNTDPIDISSMRVNEAVQYIRGKKGTEVRLTVKKPNGQILVIPIIRDIVVIEDTYAQSAIVRFSGSKRRFGYISLPLFYHDFSNTKNRNSADDIKKELVSLQSQGVDGIVLDLRNNSGGALDDAIKMAGLFIKDGPIVQIRNKDNDITIQSDPDPNIVYSGPLIVMINTFSASASEIVAAALQDYGRALIVGSGHSFGKGTVQGFFNFDDTVERGYSHLKPLGSLKISLQKFYRITGESTQYKGVLSDMVLPDTLDNTKVGEKSLSHSLPWDKISMTYFTRHAAISSKEKADLLIKSEARIRSNPFFEAIKTQSQKIKLSQENSKEPLHATLLYKEQHRAKKDIDAIRSFQDPSLEVHPNDEGALDLSQEKKDKQTEKANHLKKDAYLVETLHILEDAVMHPSGK